MPVTETLLDANEMTTLYRKPNRSAFLQAWRRDQLKQVRTIHDPINQGARSLLWRASDINQALQPKKTKAKG